MQSRLETAKHRMRLVSALLAATLIAACTPQAAPGTTPPAPSTTTTAPATSTSDPTRQVENLMALARLVNYVRFFHPSDEAADANWGVFTAELTRSISEAADPTALADLLEEAIVTVAPSVLVYPNYEQPDTTRARPAGDAMVAWLHKGIVNEETIDARAPYASERVGVPNGESMPGWFPDPTEPLTVELSAGVSATIPLVVASSDGVTMPATEPTDAPWLNTSIPLVTYPALDAEGRDTKQAALILAWGYFQHFYPYWDVVDADWNEALAQALSRTFAEPETSLQWLLEELVATAQDGHAIVTGPAEDLSSPPIRWRWVDDQLVITNVTASAPEGVVIGSVVTSIDGIDPLTAIEEAGRLVPAASPQRRQWAALTRILEGPWGSTLDITIRAPNGQVSEVSLKRTLVRVWRAVPTEEPRPEPVTILAPGVGYLDLTRIQRTDPDLSMLASVDSLVVDLRGYPSGDGFDVFARLLASPASTDRLLLPVTTRPDGVDRTYEDETWEMEPIAPRLASRIVVVTDERAQSASETLLGMVEHNGIGIVMGSPSSGTNGNIIRFIVPGGFRIAFTALKVTDSDGSQFHGVGVIPSVAVEPTVNGIADGRDEVLEAAVAYLGQ